MTPPKFTRDAGNRNRYRGQAVRGRPSELRSAALDLGQALQALTRAHDNIRRAVDSTANRAELVTEGRAQALLAVRFTRAAFKRKLPKQKPAPAAQLRLKLRGR